MVATKSAVVLFFFLRIGAHHLWPLMTLSRTDKNNNQDVITIGTVNLGMFL